MPPPPPVVKDCLYDLLLVFNIVGRFFTSDNLSSSSRTICLSYLHKLIYCRCDCPTLLCILPSLVLQQGISFLSTGGDMDSEWRAHYWYTVQTPHHVPKMTWQQWEKVETCRPSYFVSVVTTVSLKTLPEAFLFPFCVFTGRSFLYWQIASDSKFQSLITSWLNCDCCEGTTSSVHLKHHETLRAEQKCVKMVSRFSSHSHLLFSVGVPRCVRVLQALFLHFRVYHQHCISTTVESCEDFCHSDSSQSTDPGTWKCHGLWVRVGRVTASSAHKILQSVFSPCMMSWFLSEGKYEKKWSQKDKEGWEASHLLFEEEGNGEREGNVIYTRFHPRQGELRFHGTKYKR